MTDLSQQKPLDMFGMKFLGLLHPRSVLSFPHSCQDVMKTVKETAPSLRAFRAMLLISNCHVNRFHSSSELDRTGMAV